MRPASVTRVFTASRGGLGAAFLVYAVCVAALRPVTVRWGTSATDRAIPLAGDGLVSRPLYRIDHAITIHAPADSVFPWIAQIGQDRGGFYSYAWLERLAGDDIKNADRIHPEWQANEPGDLIRAVQPNYLGGRFGPDVGWRVLEVVPGRALVLSQWGVFAVEPVDATTSRFMIRTRGEGDAITARARSGADERVRLRAGALHHGAEHDAGCARSHGVDDAPAGGVRCGAVVPERSEGPALQCQSRSFATLRTTHY